MCGILLQVWKDKSCEFCQGVFRYDLELVGRDGSKDDIKKIGSKFRGENLRRRGPDSCGSVSSVTHGGYHRIRCAASVLQMRANLQEQPISFQTSWITPDDVNSNGEPAKEDNDEERDDQEAYLCWNGEVYEQVQSGSSDQKDTNSDSSEEAFMYGVADTAMVADHLRAPITVPNEMTSEEGAGDEPSRGISPPPRAAAQQHHIAKVMSRLYNAEFAFCVLTQHGVYFGRDWWGRRSLMLWKCPRNCGSFQVASVAESSPPVIKVEKSSIVDTNTTYQNLEWTEVPPGKVHCILFSKPMTKIREVVYPKTSFPIFQLPKDYRIPPIPKTISTSQSPIEGVSERLWRFSLELEFCLRRAVAIRLDQSSRRRSTGVLFSGGVDSVVLAALAADILSTQHKAERIKKLAGQSESGSGKYCTSQLECSPIPILYLYNVSFGPDPEKSADRKAALKSYHALQEKYMRRTISEDACEEKDAKENNDNHGTRIHDHTGNGCDCDIEIVFRDIVVEWEDICQMEPHIRTLIHPKHTVMDINIATALWFASRGRVIKEQKSFKDEHRDHDHDDRSPRVLLLGMGADELMGGYGRHRKAYERGGWKELKSELTMDQNRLWERNCGRDDRLCSDHGREARFPFLDAHVVQLLQETMANEDGLVCNFHLAQGVGDKRVLRLVAERLGMKYASGLVKRAIQFGSRISHLSDKKRFGSRRKAKGATKI